jgi:hypothetical protein
MKKCENEKVIETKRRKRGERQRMEGTMGGRNNEGEKAKR